MENSSSVSAVELSSFPFGLSGLEESYYQENSQGGVSEGVENPVLSNGDPGGRGDMETILIVCQMSSIFFLCAIGTFTNSLVFWIFNRRPAFRSLSNKFVLSLVTGNTLLSSIIAPLILFKSVLVEYLLLPCISELIALLCNTVIYSTIFSTFLIATDRFYAVTSPLHYSMTITRGRTQTMILLAWFFGFILSLPPIFMCIITLASASSSIIHPVLRLGSTILQLVIGHLLPFAGLCWFYSKMYRAAHRNSERTRKHSISGDLLTSIDGSSTIVPQGVEFLTHYMNPFIKAPMAGSVPVPLNPATNPGILNGGLGGRIKPRRRSSNGSASLLFREEGRAIRTALLVLGSFLLCWTPHFALTLFEELNLAIPQSIQSTFQDFSPQLLGQWTRYLSLVGMLLSSIINPFIYVFRNALACQELMKLFRGRGGAGRRGGPPSIGPGDKKNSLQNNSSSLGSRHRSVDNSIDVESNGNESNNQSNHHFTPNLNKSPKRSSMKSLTPQSSLNSTITTCNTAPDSPINFSSNQQGCHQNQQERTSRVAGRMITFTRSLTLPEENSQPRVKFPPNLVRQKSSFIQRNSSNGFATVTETTTLMYPKRPKFVRQDSICSNDSILMICEDESLMEDAEEEGYCGSRDVIVSAGGSMTGHLNNMTPKYLRQDSNFSDVSQKTNDSGVVLETIRTKRKYSDNSTPKHIPLNDLPFLQTAI